MLSRRIVVVENEPLFRDLVAGMLETAGFSVATASNVSEAKKICDQTDPDAVVIDIDLGFGPNGLDLAIVLEEESPDRGIVFLTNLPDTRFLPDTAQKIPAKAAYLRKSQLLDSSELLNAIEAVLSERVNLALRHDLDQQRPLAALSRAQMEVLKLIAEGMTNASIAESRGTTIRAVEAMVTRVFSALGIDVNSEENPRVEAARAYFSARGNAHGKDF